MATGQRTDWANYIKNVQAEQQGVANWNSIFTSMLDTQYKIGSTELERASQKNIDSAYSNYLHNQMSLKYTDGLTEGYRHYAEDSIQNEYDAAIATEQQTLANNKASLYSDLLTNTATLQQQQQEAIDEQALRMSEYENYMFKYISDGAMTNDNNETFLAQFPELFKYTTESGDDDEESVQKAIGWSDEANKFLFEEKDGTKTWSDQGKQFLSVVLGSGFDDWLKNNVSIEKYSDWDENYRTLFNEAVFGQSINPYQDTKADMAGIRESVRVDRLNTAIGNNSEGTAGDRYVTNNSNYTNNKSVIKQVFSDPVKNGGGWMHALVLADQDDAFVKAQKSNGDFYYSANGSYTDSEMSNRVNLYKQTRPGANKAYGSHITKISTELSSLYKSKNLHEGDIFLVDGGKYIAYYSGDNYWRLAQNTEANRNTLKDNAGITIPS